MSAPAAPARHVPTPFGLRAVRLDAGPLRRHADHVRAAYLRIPADDWLLGFRRRAGRPAPGVALGGWYGRDNGNIFGQLLSGLARFASLGDEACRAKAGVLLDGWGTCLSEDGYGFYSDHTTGKAYTYDKLVGGLVDMLVYAGDERAVPLLARLTDWAERHLNRARDYANADGEGAPRVAWSEWYTLSENLYRAYLATGEARYRAFAEVWEYTEYWDLYAAGRDIFGPRPGGPPQPAYHAYSHVNTLAGAGAAYRVTGGAHYLDTLRNAHDTLLATQCYATGGFGPNEQLLPRAAWLGMLGETSRHFETQCGTWAVFKLCKYLLEFTGDGRYGDWIERVLYNGLAAGLPMSAAGRVFYYSDYNLNGARKVLYDDFWSCCSGSQIMAAAEIHDLIYFHDVDGLYVNLFVPSTVTWNGITLCQRTSFPADEATELTVGAPTAREFTLRIRVPGWLAGPLEARVNGEPLAPAQDRHWLTIRRTWRSGDTVAVRLPMRPASCPLDVGAPVPAAITCGPVVLAVRSTEGPPHGRVPLNDLADALQPVPGEPRHYHVRGAPDVLVRPYFAFAEDEAYFMYLT